MEKTTNTREYPLLSLSGLVVFPRVIMHFEVSRDESVKALTAAAQSDKLIFMVAEREDYDPDDPKSRRNYDVGVVAKIKQMLRTSDGITKIMAEGEYRAKAVSYDYSGDHPKVTARKFPEKKVKLTEEETIAYKRMAKAMFSEYAKHMPNAPDEYVKSILSSDSLEVIFDNIAVSLPVEPASKQDLLEANGIDAKMARLLGILQREIEVMSVENDIHNMVREQIIGNQREYYLREQMRAISRELGEEDSGEYEAMEYTDRIKALSLAPEYEKKLLKEAQRLETMPPQSSESAVIKTYLDTVLDIPWNVFTEGKIDIAKTARILDRDHYGLKKVKERILETIAVKQLSPETKGQIICLYGPPGVGKTSVARSIAESMGRKYARIALGGVHDESDIRGHRKTYIGAMPGRIINALIEAHSADPLILLDEIDKISHDYRGDPSSALLEALDSEQNKNFRDHYVEIPFDLSNVMFITTANDISVIDPPLRDRMEIIELSSYTREEKFHIAKEHLIPKQLEKHGLTKANVKFGKASIYTLIDNYTREAGVRELERTIASLCRKAAKVMIEEHIDQVKLDPAKIEQLLGHRKFIDDVVSRVDSVGVVNGLAWTSAGGVIMPLEVLVNDGRGSVTATGSLGDVMLESSKLAVSYVRSIADRYGINKDFYLDKDIHIHAPEGATPKDGPSAGVTMTTALVSALTGIPVRSDVAMTGEITLHGKVLPIGGLREKTMAAYKEGMKTVIIPKGNKPDLDEVDETVKEKLKFIFAENITDVLDNALTGDPKKTEQKTPKVGF
ncbi:MAG: endopeptidase La [Oscillospiraceae bacterium]|nr:endopeptidase La [Oscillospiraceae bacterium]MBQ8978732.1 endopeptidase La [Oscillospiraceae bacterium]